MAWLWLVALWQPTHAHADALLELRLSTPPHAPHDAPDAIVHVPSQLNPRAPLHVLVFLHGFSSCVRALAATEEVPCSKGGAPQRGYGLAALHERLQRNSILVFPQLAFLARSAEAKRFVPAGGFDAFLAELLSGPLRERLGAELKPASVTLLAHSAGYRAAATILRDPQRKQPVHNLVLFDALYAHWDVFARWYQESPERHLVSFYTRDRQTTRGHTRLRALLGMEGRVASGEPSRHSSDSGISLRQVTTPHALVPQHHLEEALHALFGARNAQ